MHERPPVVIAGAGPTGLMCALALGAQGIPVVVCEAEASLTHDLRAGSYHPPARDMMAKSGITQRRHQHGLQVRRWQIRERNGSQVAEFDLGILSDVTAHPYRLHLEQHRLTPIQLDILRKQASVQVYFGHRVIGFAQKGERLKVRVESDGIPGTFEASWLVGADGGRSTVRKLLPIEFEGFTWPEQFLVVSTPYDFSPHGYAQHLCGRPGGMGGAFQDARCRTAGRMARGVPLRPGHARRRAARRAARRGEDEGLPRPGLA